MLKSKKIADLSFPYKNFDCDIDNCKDYVTEHGVAVVPGVLTPEEVEAARNSMWTMLEGMLKNCKKPFDRNDTDTWSSYFDLMPMHGMLLQHFKVGQSQFAWDVRQNPKVADAFGKLWNEKPENMVSSFDGVSIHLPPEQTNKGFFRNSLWFHVDQSYCDSQFECLQGMITLWDVEDGDATLACWPGSHKVHAEYGKKFGLTDPKVKGNRDHWQKASSEDHYAWLESKGLAPNCVRAKAGSLILWDSRTMHQGIQSVKDRKNPKPRCVVYVCQKPRSGAGEEALKKRRKAFDEGRVTTHWPYPVKTFAKKPRTYGLNVDHIVTPEEPQLTPLGRRLAGFE